MDTSGLSVFHPDLAAWFSAKYAQPTAVQAEAWPQIASGRHVLATAPTGSGKTLTAFLWSLNRFASGEWQTGATKVLYLSPLKALNNDVRVNLLEPLSELREQQSFPQVTVQVRSGDTSQSDRQRMLRSPPDILITTPESLHLLLTSKRGQQALSTIETVILDEVHALVDNRRGAQLMVSVERLAHLAGEFQRIALSATVNPLEAVARYVAGRTPRGEDRQVEIVNAVQDKSLDFRVRFPEEAKYAVENGKKIWDPLAENFKGVIDGNRSTLFFTNSRALAEKITLKINEDERAPLAYAHHGSLARDIRTEVEQRLKAGELKAIVATNSLEMGIDVGALDEVVMVQSPPSIASALQRIGRAGHQVGATGVGTLYPTHAHDFLEAAVLANQVAQRRIEPLSLIRGPLDVLVQIIVSMCAHEERPVREVYEEICCATPYHELTMAQFELVVEMLAGRYAGSRVRELKPRVAFDRVKQTLKASKGALLAMYNSGGNIPDRGYYTLRHADSGTPIGELDEEFVWEATTGQVFTLGTQNWQIQRITHNDVLVRAAKPNTTAPPFWRNEGFNRSFYFSERINEYLETADAQLAAGDAETIRRTLTEECGFEPTAAHELVHYLERQRQHTECALPHRHHILLELVEGGPDGYRGPNAPKQLVIHTQWGGALNRPFAYALDAALRRNGVAKPEIHSDNAAVVVQCQEIPDPAFILSLVTAGNLDELLREGLERSGYFGARFRECAGRSLLLTKKRFDQRLPLWMSRLQAKKLMTATRQYKDFPVLLETWRTCLQDEFDIPALRRMLDELGTGTCEWSFAHTRTPSPFAGYVRFEQVSRYMYADDTPEMDQKTGLQNDLIEAAVNDPDLRRPFSVELIREFTDKRQRLLPEYRPSDMDDLVEWVKERALIPEDEWQTLCEGLPFEPVHEYIAGITRDKRRWVTHAEHAGIWRTAGVETDGTVPDVASDSTIDDLCVQVLSFYGPLTRESITALLPEVPETLWETLAVSVQVGDDLTPRFCDRENLDILLRFQRASRRAHTPAISAQQLPAFWHDLQKFAQPADPQGIADVLELISGAPLPANVLLNDVVQARFPATFPQDLDQAFAEQGFVWFGAGTERVTLCYPEDDALLPAPGVVDGHLAECFRDANARYDFHHVSEAMDTDTARVNALWWQAVWAGALYTDSLTPLRDAAGRRFTLAGPAQSRSRRQRVRALVRGWQGYWALRTGGDPLDPLETLERNKERCRVLLDRYGVVCREIVVREGWRWADLFRSLRIMELAGEVTQGLFVHDLGGPQFASNAALQRLNHRKDDGKTWWLNATDPASPCGLGLPWDELPQRRPSNYLAFCDGILALVAENGGKRLTYHVPADHENLDAINHVLVHLTRERRQLSLDTINGTPAKQSTYLDPLSRVLTITHDHKGVIAQT